MATRLHPVAGRYVPCAPRLGEEVRYEVKMVAPGHAVHEVRGAIRIHPYGLVEAYPSRIINNVYFDSRALDAYWDNKAGVGDRSKVRLRWYGCSPGPHGQFEVKHKRGTVGWKLLQPQVPFDLDGPWFDIVRSLREALHPAMRSWLDLHDEPLLINRYVREYYVTLDGLVRVTLDQDLKAFDQRMDSFPNVTRPAAGDGRIVVEVKGPAARRDDVARVVEHIPLRVTNNSKYVLGVEGAG